MTTFSTGSSRHRQWRNGELVTQGRAKNPGRTGVECERRKITVRESLDESKSRTPLSMLQLQLRSGGLLQSDPSTFALPSVMLIEFSDEFRCEAEWIIFPAVVDGRVVENRITNVVLEDRFAAESGRESREGAFRVNRELINEIARRMIVAGVVDDGGAAAITSDAIFRYDPALVR
jgi:hypothetical protein